MESVGNFAAEAERFETWARDATDEGEWAAREALLRIAHLYLAALQLPPAWSDELSDDAEPERLSHDEWCTIFAKCSRLPFDGYSIVFEPLEVPPSDEPVVSSIADDIADIYRDVVSGLRAYRRGQRPEAIWEWGFGFRNHRGRHATCAIGALHAWLAENAFDRLSSTA
jgi:hypothetical protein